ncbi:IucA/IucC family siderophore biosynthesis protein [Flavobacterium sp. EDS]|uniref:IucA/IucC family protein n=1 Tax=Flavobacterium sp. EDS TaxID=2897328 RepID=UPI001E4BE088|nr:IucA/IucC family siderophore biosynthesis protein [Flavobacterium sp. EDS]MCD0476513.1 IucA/IucC family siderophore biosynthesis protein [Flavobacterium sp. EDS]
MKEKSRIVRHENGQLNPQLVTSHLQPEIWEKVNRIQLRKMLCEYSHELLLSPQLQNTNGVWGFYYLNTQDGITEYQFRAQILALDHWHIDTDSIAKTVHGNPEPLDAVAFLLEFTEELGFTDLNLPTYLEEVISCLYGSAYMHTNSEFSAKDLTEASYADVEHAMTAGHPCFVANSARIGFDAVDYQNYSPEAATPLSLVWVAGHKNYTEFTSIPPLSYQQVMKQELDTDLKASFDSILIEKGLQPEDYIFFPIHPWQWHNKLIYLFAPDIAASKLVCLGDSKDLYMPQQSVRTFFNVSNVKRFYVKSALSILNMGFMRGLSPYFMRTNPPISEWVANLVENDPYLQKKGFTTLKEIAAVGYTNAYIEEAIKVDSPYKKMLSTLWRESPMDKIANGERLMTMAALLHIDTNGNSLLAELIKSSPLDAKEWLQSYLQSYLSPLLHCFYYHDMRFMPHGENLILVFRDNVPVRAIMKDIGEEVAIVNQEKELPETIKRIIINVPEDLKILSIFTQIFDSFFRYLNHVLVEHVNLPEEDFWSLVAECVTEYQSEYPELEDKFRKYDLFDSEIIKTCSNRLQMQNSTKMLDATNPFKNQQFAGTLKNPLSIYQTKLI